MSRYQVSEKAKDDLAEIWAYVAERKPSAARPVIDRILRTYRLLAEFPLIGQRAEHLGSGLRTFPVGKYLVIYIPLRDGVQIVRVIHGARDIPAVLKEEPPPEP